MDLREQLNKLIKENSTKSELARRLGVNRQSLHDTLKRDMRMSSFEKIVDTLGYKVKFEKK